MAGDPFEDAYNADFDAVVLAASPSIPWRRKDLDNTGADAGPPAADATTANAGWFEVSYEGGSEAQYTFGAPGANFHRETGQITIRAVTRLRAGATVRDAAAAYLAQLRAVLRTRKTPLGSQEIRIIETMPMGSGQDEAGNWVRSLGLAYRVFNVG